MPSYELDPGAYDYRPLKQGRVGWDVYAVQTGLHGLGYILATDGIYWGETHRIVRDYQRARFVAVDAHDGIAGIQTQRRIALDLVRRANREHEVLKGLLKGQVEKESGYQLGNHTPPYRDGTRDCGVAQRNTAYASIEDAFDAAESIDVLASQVRRKFEEYRELDVVTWLRAWELAAGSWNRPAYTDALARGRDYVIVGGQRVSLAPGSVAREWIEGYIERVTAYI